MPTASSATRDKLTESAVALFSQEGFRNVNLDRIAARAGVTKGSLYWHYKSRNELILAACEHFYVRWQEGLHAAIDDVADPLERLRAALLYSVDSCLLTPANRVFESEVYAAALHDEKIRAGWVRFYNTALDLFVGLVESAREAGRIPTRNPHRAVGLMIATIDGIEKRAAFDPSVCDPKQRKAILEDLMRIICQT